MLYETAKPEDLIDRWIFRFFCAATIQPYLLNSGNHYSGRLLCLILVLEFEIAGDI